MPFKITDKCTACGSCKDTCPVEAISEGDPCYVIDADACIDCGACVDSCPVEAIEEA
jgi:NAD-dependent dihydropyrimidine dehydrogenase PreA subunit